jgi:hypothetical protein
LGFALNTEYRYLHLANVYFTDLDRALLPAVAVKCGVKKIELSEMNFSAKCVAKMFPNGVAGFYSFSMESFCYQLNYGYKSFGELRAAFKNGQNSDLSSNHATGISVIAQ